MNFDEVLNLLRNKNEPVPKPMRLPTEKEVAEIEGVIGRSFHPEYRKYLLCASDVVLGSLEPAQITIPNSHDFLLSVIEDARSYGCPDDLLPICEDNGSFYCIDSSGMIQFWGVEYGGLSGENWPNLANWIEEVWIGERA